MSEVRCPSAKCRATGKMPVVPAPSGSDGGGGTNAMRGRATGRLCVVIRGVVSDAVPCLLNGVICDLPFNVVGLPKKMGGIIAHPSMICQFPPTRRFLRTAAVICDILLGGLERQRVLIKGVNCWVGGETRLRKIGRATPRTCGAPWAMRPERAVAPFRLADRGHALVSAFGIGNVQVWPLFSSVTAVQSRFTGSPALGGDGK